MKYSSKEYYQQSVSDFGKMIEISETPSSKEEIKDTSKISNKEEEIKKTEDKNTNKSKDSDKSEILLPYGYKPDPSIELMKKNDEIRKEFEKNRNENKRKKGK